MITSTASLRRSMGWMALVSLFTGTAAYAQISSINSISVQPRVFNDVPGSSLDILNKYPAGISITDSGVSQPTGFANRHTWSFSNNGGTSAYQLHNNDYFQVSFDLTLTGNPISPRKEAGLLLANTSSGDIQFIVNTDGHEVVQFGGIGFYSFSGNNVVSYNAGDKITLGMTYFLDSNGKNALIFSANGVNSPVEEFASGGIGDGSTLGGYFQIVNDPTNPLNSGTASFAKISISSVPEPSTFLLFGLSVLPLLWMRRRQS